jgi:hypothetical protein
LGNDLRYYLLIILLFACGWAKAADANFPLGIWNYCAKEGQACYSPLAKMATRTDSVCLESDYVEVVYGGRGGPYLSSGYSEVKIMKNNFICDNTTFGDVNYGVVKYCWARPARDQSITNCYSK